MTLQQFKDKYLGKQVEYHSYGAGAYNQCVDLINAYINEVLDNSTKDYTEIIGTNAKDFNTKYDPEDFDWIANTPSGVPQTGDIIVWNGKVGGGAGHVGIFLQGDANKFTSLDQNWSKVEHVTVENHTYTNVSGWLRPKNKQEINYQAIIDQLREERDNNYRMFVALCDIMGTSHNLDIAKEELKKLVSMEDIVRDKDRQLEDAKKKIESLTDDIKAVEQSLTEAEQEATRLTKQVDEQQKTIDGQANDLEVIRGDLESLRKQCQIPETKGWKKHLIELILSL